MMPGISTDDIYLIGKVVAKSATGDNWIPSSLPEGMSLETQAIATFDGTKGNFRFVPVGQSRLDGIRAMGERVAGYLRVSVRN
ncbi:hypothetical protein [Nostoc sp.]|uniref:hypothetical protein n=1 Tax=Nostoc sp. TaxID=1180 RepID=UPI002FFAEBA9